MKTIHTVEVGDVFYESWGYDQTNSDFYQVVAVTPKSVRIRMINARRVGEGHQARLVPDVGNFVEPSNYDRGGKGIRSESGAVKRVQQSGVDGRPYLNMTSYSNAYLTDPETSHFDTIAAGYPGH